MKSANKNMNSIKFKFLMFVIGMIAFTSCNSETEQTQESVKTSLTQRPDPGEFVPDEDEALYIIEDEISGINTPEKRAKINCMTSEGIGSGFTHYNACVTVNGNQYNVHVWTDSSGAVVSTHTLYYTYGGCSC